MHIPFVVNVYKNNMEMVLMSICKENTTTNSLVIGFHCIISSREMKVADRMKHLWSFLSFLPFLPLLSLLCLVFMGIYSIK